MITVTVTYFGSKAPTTRRFRSAATAWAYVLEVDPQVGVRSWAWAGPQP